MLHIKYTQLSSIEGEKVHLRPIRDEDTDNIIRWRNDPEVWRYFLFREPFTYEMHTNWLKKKVKTGRVVQYIINDRSTGKDIGSVYFRDIDGKNESAEYGIFIGEGYARNHGIGTEVADIFTQFGFEELGLHRIYLKVLGDNEIARRSYEKAGFKTEGIFRDFTKIDNKFTDVVFMAKLNEKGNN